ncbi:DUF397 domain-containing protein [Streptomyces sp. NPDC002845]
MHPIHWQKSTYSGDSTNCVYVAAPTGAVIRLRESDEPDVILTTTQALLHSLIRALKSAPQPPRH